MGERGRFGGGWEVADEEGGGATFWEKVAENLLGEGGVGWVWWGCCLVGGQGVELGWVWGVC